MFAAGANTGYGASDGLGGIYAEKGKPLPSNALGASDALRCSFILGPFMLLLGSAFIVRVHAGRARGGGGVSRGAA
jgi:hypothetical protein